MRTHLVRLDRLLIRGVAGVALSALIVASAGSFALQPLWTADDTASREQSLTPQALSGTRGERTRAALCERVDPPLTSFNRNS